VSIAKTYGLTKTTMAAAGAVTMGGTGAIIDSTIVNSIVK